MPKMKVTDMFMAPLDAALETTKRLVIDFTKPPYIGFQYPNHHSVVA